MGFASSRAQRRQLVSTAISRVNERPTNIPYVFWCVRGRCFRFEKRADTLAPMVAAVEKAGGRRLPSWLQIEERDAGPRGVAAGPGGD